MFLALWFLYILGPRLLASQSTELGLYTAIDLSLLLSIISFALSLWFGFKGNEMTAKSLLKDGWIFAEPTSETTGFAVAK